MYFTRSHFSKLSFLIFLISILLYPFSISATEQKTVRIPIGIQSVFVLDNTDGHKLKHNSYSFEYIEKIASYAGWNLEFVQADSFYDSLDKIINGKADVYFGVSKTAKRENFMLFPNLPMGTKFFTLYAHKDNKEIDSSDLSTLNGKKIGIFSDSHQTALLKNALEKLNIDYDIIPYLSPVEKTKDLLSGKIDLVCEGDFISNPQYKAITKIGESPFYLVVNKDRSDLLKDINTAQQKLFVSNPFFISNLMEKYFYQSTSAKALSANELNWVKKHHSIKVGCLNDSPPFSAKDSMTGKISGSAVELTQLLLKNLNITHLNLELCPFQSKEDAIVALKEGTIDLFFPYYSFSNLPQEKGIITTKNIGQTHMSVVFKSDTESSEIMRDVAVVSNSLSNDFLRDHFPKSNVQGYKNIQECLDAVKREDATSVVAHTKAITDSAWGDPSLQIQTLHNNCMMTYAARTDNIDLISTFDRALHTTPEGEIIPLIYNYTIPKKQTIMSFVRMNLSLIIFITFSVLLIISFALIKLFHVHRKLVNVSNIVLKQKKKLESQQVHLIHALGKANAANKAKTTFLFNMSHDIRTPMNAIIGFTNRAFKNLGDNEIILNCLIKLRKAETFLLNILNDILELSNLEKGNIKLSLKQVNIKKLFEDLDTMFRESATDKKISLSFNVHNIKNAEVCLDPTHVTKILFNLISNAFSYNKEGGWVKVELSQTDEFQDDNPIFIFTVEDNGIGMSEEFQKHMYEAFTREQNTTQTGIPGTGIGLTICKNLIELMKGSIHCRSTKGIGTLFIVKLHFQLPKQVGQASSSTSQKFNPFFLEDKKCLIVEDNELNREILTDILEDSGLVVDTAENGEVAVQKLRQYGAAYFDFILMDIQMPVMNGYEAAKAIRAMYPDVHIPIIAVSANAFEEDIKLSQKAEMDGHIAKPVDSKLLFKTLEQYLS